MRLSRFSLKTLSHGRKLLQGQASRFCSPVAQFSSKDDGYPGDDPNFENPITRTGRILKNDIIRLKDNVAEIAGFQKLPRSHNIDDIDEFYSWQSHTDVLIIGGGVVGSSIAFFLEESFPGAMNITVLEKDPTYARAATTLSCGGLRQQFSLPENILMSKFGANFLRELPKRCAVKGLDPPDVQFNPTGYLFLASEAGAEQLANNHAVQLECGVKNKLLSKQQLKQRFPWLNTDDVELGCLGMENEGWFDPWSLLNALRDKAISLGAKFVQGEGIGFEFKELPDTFISGDTSGDPYNKIDKLVVRLKSGEERKITFGLCIIASGSSSGDVAEMAKIGTGEGMLSFPLPVVPRKRFVYNIHCPKGPGIDLPFLIDPTGTYIRREGYGGHYICGRSPPEGEPEPTTNDFEVDHEFFENHVWPHLAHRVPAMQEIKVKSAWAGHYDYNTFDQNAILGYHPYYNNLIIASGFSGHGLQQAPAVGQAVMELIAEGSYKSIDLSRFSFDRLMFGQQVLEQNIV